MCLHILLSAGASLLSQVNRSTAQPSLNQLDGWDTLKTLALIDQCLGARVNVLFQTA